MMRIKKRILSKPFRDLIKKSKYGNKKTIVDGINFSSKGEARRYLQLKLLERSGHSKNMQLQVRYHIVINGLKVCTYIADFVYFSIADGITIVEDFKGMRTPVYKLKKKLMKSVLGIDIFETSP